MNQEQTTINPQEVAKFTKLAASWWDPKGELRTLHAINPSRMALIEKHIQPSGLSVLDVGCGGGIMAEAMAAKGAKVTGLDADEAAIGAAQAHAKGQGLSIDYYCAAIEQFEQPAFDMITCMEMLEHVQHPQTVIQHCTRLLKPGGLLFLSTLNRTVKAYGQAIVMAEYVLSLLPRQTHEFNQFITPSELAAMVRNSQLDVVDLVGMHYHPLTGKAELVKDVAVNYLMVAKAD